MTDQEAQLHAAMISMGVEVCGCDPPCHQPTLLIEVLAFATAGGRFWEIHTTLRDITP